MAHIGDNMHTKRIPAYRYHKHMLYFANTNYDIPMAKNGIVVKNPPGSKAKMKPIKAMKHS